jgi:hypothetical protein
VLQTVINGVSEASLQKVLNLKDIELSERLLARYKHGCIILGLVNGKVIYDTRLKSGSRVVADWDQAGLIISPNNEARLLIPDFGFYNADSNISADSMLLNINFILADNPDPMRLRFSPVPFPMYLEILDAQKRVLLIGFQ